MNCIAQAEKTKTKTKIRKDSSYVVSVQANAEAEPQALSGHGSLQSAILSLPPQVRCLNWAPCQDRPCVSYESPLGEIFTISHIAEKSKKPG